MSKRVYILMSIIGVMIIMMGIWVQINNTKYLKTALITEAVITKIDMKQIIIMSLILVSIFSFKFCGKRESSSPETDAPTEYTYESVEESTINGRLKNMSYVDSEIHSLIVSDDFQKANLDGRIILMQDVMEQLVEEGSIEDYQISTYNKNVSFEYAGGGFGAVMLEEFPKDQN